MVPSPIGTYGKRVIGHLSHSTCFFYFSIPLSPGLFLKPLHSLDATASRGNSAQRVCRLGSCAVVIMPYVDFESEDGYVSIFYTTNSNFGNVGGFDAEKPTVLMLHPVFLDSSWLAPQFSDPRLTDNFNLIALDMRVTGKSRSKVTPKHDSWVDAADLAFFHLVRTS